jgi:hypothetical protein
MEKGKRHCTEAWAKKKKLCKERPVELVEHFDFSQVKPGLEEWEIVFRACGLLLKESTDGFYKILVVCCMDVAGCFFKLTSMGPKAEKLYTVIEVWYCIIL